MFEYNQYRPQLLGSSSTPVAAYTPVRDVEQISLLVWGEHCIECAAPACFQSCDLYDPRPDGRCRRFTFGAFKNESFSSFRGFGTEVSFKKWAKVEARGNAALTPVWRVLFYEKAIAAVLPLVDLVGRAIFRLSGDERWSSLSNTLLERLGRGLHAKWGSRTSPDAFLLELYNPSNETVRLRLSISAAKAAAEGSPMPTRFQASVEALSGYSRHELETFRFAELLRTGLPFDISMSPEGDTNARLVFLTADFVRFAPRQGNSSTAKIKCVVWDLDNTLWNGVLLESERVELKTGVREIVKRLDERGILLSIASKNNFDHAWKELDSLGLAEFFLHPQINWNPKSQSVEAIASHLNIGLDTFAFIDDSPFELGEMSRALPHVTTVDADAIHTLLADPRFQGSDSDDARNRRRYYQEALQRSQAQQALGSDYRQFLAASELKLEVAPYQPTDHERVAELVQRTNQLNFSGRKYTREEVDKLLALTGLEHYVLRCEDKYGSYGTVGFSSVERLDKEIRVRDFMLSCRVQGRFVEQAFFDALIARTATPVHTFSVEFVSTGRNEPARQTLATLNFRGIPGENRMTLDCRQNPLNCDFITLVSSNSDMTRAQSEPRKQEALTS